MECFYALKNELNTCRDKKSRSPKETDGDKSNQKPKIFDTSANLINTHNFIFF